MSKLFLQRHGHSDMPPDLAAKAFADFTPEELDRDKQRKLSDRGKDEVRQAAMAMRLRGDRPSVILSSPFVRCAQTASIMGDVLGCSVMLSDLLEPHRKLDNWIGRIMKGKESPIPDKRAMLVGHHDNMLPALAKLFALEMDDIGPMGTGEVRVVRNRDGDWRQVGRYIPAAGEAAPQPVTAAVAPLRQAPLLTATAKR